ncbi:hypothetical protein [Paenirhodobacter sp. CAU 1674]|uniref:hypothetical protein n=1 Tax=Paenirhodobacter sp. CAU 1674 TaxID=3032596 RepID=UPI0023DCA2C7|nr:hypothetical protein [Paenirhodobacter sp. CAU 1674]MDF2140811.1 hypothetical protein [Paenirhodobacter sp. CAU 1674]
MSNAIPGERCLSETLQRAEAMVTALQIVLWDFAQDELHGEANRKRGAIIALGDQLEAILKGGAQ